MTKSNVINKKAPGLDFILDHPYISAFIACMVAHFTTFVDNTLMPTNSYIILTVATCAFVLYVVNLYTKEKGIDKAYSIVAKIGVILIVFFLAVGYQAAEIKGIFHIIIGGGLALMLFWMIWRKGDRNKAIIVLILTLCFLLKFYYAFKTSMYVRQHDIGSFDGEHGHFAYIQYIYDNWSLLDKDPRPYWQFYHPPLHHTISAIWMWINLNVFGTGINPAREGIQTLSLFYSMVIIITAYKILEHFKVKGVPLYAALTVVAFHPSFVLLAGSVNNDTLSIALEMLAVLFTLKWSENQTMGGIVKIALCVGLAMMTKISTAVVAIPIGIVLVMVLIKNRREKSSELMLQYAVLGMISFPLGLGYQIRNFTKFGVPITYVQELSKDIDQYLGEGNFISRITDFSFYQFENVFLAWGWNENVGYNETNPLIALMKTAMFEESIREGTFPSGTILGFIAAALFWVSIIIAIVAFVAMIIVLVRKCAMNVYEKVLCGSFWLVTMVSYYKMAYDYPFVCTISFRYVTPVIILGVIFLGVLAKKLDEGETKAGKIFNKSLLALSVTFASLSMIAYTVVSKVLF